MGPGSYLALIRATLAAVPPILFGRNGLVAIAAKEIKKALINKDLEVAETLMQDMANRHKSDFTKFLKKHKSEIPDELIDKFQEYL